MKKNAHFKKGRIVFFLFCLLMIGNFAWGQSTKNGFWIIGATGNHNQNDPSKNQLRADVTVGAGGTYTSLDIAIHAALSANHNKIYIQEGLYSVSNSIIIDGRFNGNAGNAELYRNNITIEGEGYGTRILPTNGFNGAVFTVKSEFNTIRNLSINIESGFGTIGILFQKSPTVLNGVTYPVGLNDTRYNIIENIFIGHKNRTNYEHSSVVNGLYGIVLENANVSASAIVYNKFKNISMHGLEAGIKMNKLSTNSVIWTQDNVFENFDFNWVKNIIDFGGANTLPVQSERNVFKNFTIQFQHTFVGNQFENINGNDNVFSGIQIADFPVPAPCRIFNIVAGGNNKIENSTLGSIELHANTNDLIDNGFGTQLLGNERAGISKNLLGFDGVNNPNGNKKTLTEIKGALKISAQSGTLGTSALQNTAAAGKVLMCMDNQGRAQWGTVASTAWNHIASQNIKMNNFAIVNNPAVPDPTSAPGIRLDNNGNVRIGTAEPESAGEKLQVDGDILAKRGKFVAEPVYFGLETDESLSPSILSAGNNINQKEFDFGINNFQNSSGPLNGFLMPYVNSKQTYLNVSEGFKFTYYSSHDLGDNDSNLKIGNNILIESETNLNVRPNKQQFSKIILKNNAYLGVGTEQVSFLEPQDASNPSSSLVTNSYRVAVNGNLRAKGIRVSANGWADYVFNKNFKLMPINELENYISKNNHLPNIPSEKAVLEYGIDTSEMFKLQMAKIEELTLYIIEQNKKMEVLSNEVQDLKNELNKK